MSDRELLSELAETFPWRDVQETNVCAFCDASWEHSEDCLWVRVRVHLSLADPYVDEG